MEVTPYRTESNSRYATLVLVRTKVIGVDSAGLRLSPLAGNVKTGTYKKIGHCDGTYGGLDSSCLRNFTGVPCSSGLASCARGRRGGNVGCDAGHVLGRTCHGADRRRWAAVRSRCVSGAKRMLTVRSCKLALIQTSEDRRSQRFRLIGTSDRDRNNTGFLHWEIVPSREQGIAYENHFLQ
jgi:hypothetical protein